MCAVVVAPQNSLPKNRTVTFTYKGKVCIMFKSTSFLALNQTFLPIIEFTFRLKRNFKYILDQVGKATCPELN